MVGVTSVIFNKLNTERMSVDLKDKYREETNKYVYSTDTVYGGSGSYSDDYVKWLEKQVKNNDLLHSVSKCACPPLVACEICGEEKNLDGDFWKNKKKHDC